MIHKDYKEFLRKLEIDRENEKDEKYIAVVGGVFVVVFFIGLMIYIYFNK